MKAMRIFQVKGIWLLGVGALLMVLPFVVPRFWVSMVIQMLIYAILAMSLDILLGYTGLPAFGHAGFFGTGAYVVGILSTRYGQGFWVSSLGAIILTTAVAAIFGLVCVHASGVYFLIITMALGMVLWGLAYRWVSMTGGDNGVTNIPKPDIGLPIDFSNPTTFYFFIFVVFVLAFLAMFLLIKSPFGQSLKGLRESESRMRTLGYNTWLHKYLSYVIAAAFAGIAGTLWAFFNEFVSPHDIDIVATMDAYFMAILGGPGTLIGPALGAGIIIFLKTFISAYTQRWLIILGCLYIIMVFYAPEGLVNFVIDYVKLRKAKMANLPLGPKD